MDDWDLDLTLPTHISRTRSDSGSDSGSDSDLHSQLDPPENPITLAIGIFTW